MQVFRVVVNVHVNTIEPVSNAELREELDEVLKDFAGGEANVCDVEEYK